MSETRVRFAPSPTGGLHLGGVRTVLFNYLFAKNNNGKFIVRTEDTDQTRFVAGAEKYIFDCLAWCGITPDESTLHGGEFAPYRQSERKNIYKQYAQQLIYDGNAYYAFDTAEELTSLREKASSENKTFQYDHSTRAKLKNSLNLMPNEVEELMAKSTPFVIRIKVMPNETIGFTDLIRGEISNESSTVDDKVLLKADGMPTYHLAVVVDDYLMKISHAFRGEEWLPSAPVHILLWKYLFGLDKMPKWAHLPLILKPDGNGKLSKRDGERLGFPVYATAWEDKAQNIITNGFKEIGFLPEAFVNMLALLGWNDGTGKEIFSMKELIENFSLDRVNSSGAKFDFEKAKWVNQEWIKKLSATELLNDVKQILHSNNITTNDENLITVIDLVKERCTLLSDFYIQAAYFFNAPINFDLDAIKPKWDENKKNCFATINKKLETVTDFNAENIEIIFKENAVAFNLKLGDLQLPFRIMLVGQKIGPTVFVIAQQIGKEETIKRINHLMNIIA